MSKNVLIYMSGLSTPVQGKMMQEKGKTSLLFSNENGRYYVVATNETVSVSLTGEVGYSLSLEKNKLTALSLSYGATKTYPTPVTTQTLYIQVSATYGKIEATYAISDYDENYDGCEEDDRETVQSFSLSWQVTHDN